MELGRAQTCQETSPAASDQGRAVGLYVHVPFCVARCAYCDFVSYAGREHLFEDYTSALQREIEISPPLAVRTVYFGGGTPTVLGAGRLVRLLDAVRDQFAVAHNAEITCEANPGTTDVASLTALHDSGFNRLSIGVQSLDDDVLVRLGRAHDAATALRAVADAHTAGFARVGVDLIYGVPGQSLGSWRRTLAAVCELDVEHVSAYCLSVEKGTPLATQIATGTLAEPDDDLTAQMMAETSEALERTGYEHYEIANFARPGARCTHNVDCWRYRDYLGVGVAAHSKLGGMRFANGAGLERYVSALIGAGAEGEGQRLFVRGLTPRDQAIETTILGLRLLEGIETDRLRAVWRRAGIDISQQLQHLQSTGLIEIGTAVRLSERGVNLANEVFREFL